MCRVYRLPLQESSRRRTVDQIFTVGGFDVQRAAAMRAGPPAGAFAAHQPQPRTAKSGARARFALRRKHGIL
jgi:hypothetical protein